MNEIKLGSLIIHKKKIRGPQSKQGISTKGLPISYVTILDYNKVVRKYHEDDRFIESIFYIEKEHINNQKITRIYFNPHTKEISSKEYIKKQYNDYPWTCAYCKEPIMSKLHDITAKNFTCDRCYEIYIKDSNEINSRIVESSYRFTQEVKDKIKKQNKKLIKYIKRNNEKI